VKTRAAVLLTLFAWTAAPSLDPAAAVRSKIKQIQSGKARPGTIFTFTPGDLNAYARSELPQVAPEGVRQPRLELGNGTATGYAFIDFLRLRHSQGSETPWLLSKLIEGEKPVKVNARIESGGGRATIYLQSVELSGLAVSGATLDFLIKTFFLPLYPDAKINEPFELSDRVDRIEVSPSQARVVIRK
jgi:hypothetical protein